MPVPLLINLAKSLRVLRTRQGTQVNFSSLSDEIINRKSEITNNVNTVTFNNKLDTDNEEINEKNTKIFLSNKFETRYYKRKQQRLLQEEISKEIKGEDMDDKKLYERCVKPIKAKKSAIILGYCGVNYTGMQRNPQVATIEEDLLKALLEARYITKLNYMYPGSVHFQRCSRTDKAVSAATQLVSIDLPLEVKVDEINKHLPSCIKVFTIKRTANKFDAKSDCNGRTYAYNVPSYVFEPRLTYSSLHDKKAYRLSAEKWTIVNKILGEYHGVKKYHNFTEKKYYDDPKSVRHIWEFNIKRLYMESEMEFVELLVKGQSFMMHQIRKMVGLMIAIVRGHTDQSTIRTAFLRENLITPRAPGLGLLLDKLHFEGYNKRFQRTHEQLDCNGIEDMVMRFKHEQIYPHMVKGEIEDNSIGIWLERELLRHDYTGLKWSEKRIHDDEDDDENDNHSLDILNKER